MRVKHRKVKKVGRWSDQSYKHLINSLGGIVWEADARTSKVTFVSEEAERLLGYPVEQWLNDPNFWLEHMHPDDVARAPYLKTIAASRQRQHAFEYRMIAADGHVVWLQDVITVVHENGVPTKLRGVIVDITERKQTEEAQRLSEARFRALFEQMPLPTRILAADGRSLETNPALADLLGATPEQLAQYNPLQDEQLARAGQMPLIRELFNGELEAFSVPASVYSGPGRDRWIRSFAYPIKDETGNLREVVFMAEDVTEQIKSREELRLSEQRFRSLFEQSPIPIQTFQPNGDVIQANQAFLDLFGLTTGTAIPYNILNDERIMEREGAGALRKAFGGEAARIPLTYFSTSAFEEAQMSRGRWIESFAYPVKDESGAVREVVLVVEDVTERKEAEERAQIQEEHYRAVFEATTDGLTISELDGSLVAVNPAFAEMHGYTLEEMAGMNPLTFIHPDYHDAVPGFFETIVRGKQEPQGSGPEIAETVRAGKRYHQGMAQDVRKDGSVFPVEVHGTMFMYKGEPHILCIVRDITERVEAEEQLKLKEEQYRAIFEATADGLSINDLDGNLVTVNPAFARMHGYAVEEMNGMDPFTFIHPDDHQHVPLAFAAFRAGKEYQQTLGKDVRKDGSVFPIELHGTRFMYRGEPHILCIVRDITERVESEERLRLKEDQYRAVFEATTDGLAIAELTAGTIIEVNPAWARMHGYEREEMVGMHPSVFVHPDDYAIQAEFMEKARAGERAYTEGRDFRKDGSILRMEVRAAPFTYNNQPHVLAIMRDISERLQAEEQLKLKEEQYRAIFEATSDGLVISDLEGNVLEVNPAFAAMEGYTREELVGMDPRQWIHPDSHGNLAGYLEKVRAGERFRVEGVQVRKDGTMFHAEVHEAPFVYNGQRHTLAIIRDITERVQARELLEQRVEERTRELSTLLEVSNNVASTLELKPLLVRILEQLRLVADYNRARITVAGEGEISVSSVWTVDAESKQLASTVEEPIEAQHMGIIGETLASGEPVIVDDIWDGSKTARNMREAILGEPESIGGATEKLIARLEGERSMLLVPLLLKDKIVGGMILRHKEPGYYTERHAELAMAIANQAAIAIENAHLLAESRDKARLEERQRLARELHDSVTQALFSISLIARSAEVIIQREGTHSEQVTEKMTDLRQLTQGALAEMRALIFELRPGALEEAGLLEALRKHAAAVEAREMLPVAVVCGPANDLPRLKPAAEEALYRIAQEALHNVVKHARATKAEVRIESTNDEIKLRVSDNGVGFDMGSVPAGHMGLGTMGERTHALGGKYTAESRLGEGTTITACVPLEEWRLPR